MNNCEKCGECTPLYGGGLVTLGTGVHTELCVKCRTAFDGWIKVQSWYHRVEDIRARKRHLAMRVTGSNMPTLDEVQEVERDATRLDLDTHHWILDWLGDKIGKAVQSGKAEVIYD